MYFFHLNVRFWPFFLVVLVLDKQTLVAIQSDMELGLQKSTFSSKKKIGVPIENL